jgi:hypothetical protein
MDIEAGLGAVPTGVGGGPARTGPAFLNLIDQREGLTGEGDAFALVAADVGAGGGAGSGFERGALEGDLALGPRRVRQCSVPPRS